MKQIEELKAYYPETQLVENKPEKQEYRIPIKLSVSNTPLYVRM